MKPFVSIVTPVYNTEKYLDACIESVLAQTHDQWEYIIIDNCSKDRSGEIAEKYARRDARIRVIHNAEFLSQMQNWNHSMRQISSDSRYCKVVHADDWIFAECIDKMVQVAEAHPSVGIVGSYRLDEETVNLDGLPFPSTVVSGRDICRSRLLGGPFLFGSPTSLLLRSEIIRSRKSFYNEKNIHADTEVCFDILSDWDFGFVHQVLTYTRRHNEAATTRIRNLNIYRISKLEMLRQFGHIFLSDDEYEKEVQRQIDGYHTYLARMMLKGGQQELINYHRSKLSELGVHISSSKLFKKMIFELSNFGNVINSIERRYFQ